MPYKGRNFYEKTLGKSFYFVICMISRPWFQTKLLPYIVTVSWSSPVDTQAVRCLNYGRIPETYPEILPEITDSSLKFGYFTNSTIYCLFYMVYITTMYFTK